MALHNEITLAPTWAPMCGCAPIAFIPFHLVFDTITNQHKGMSHAS